MQILNPKPGRIVDDLDPGLVLCHPLIRFAGRVVQSLVMQIQLWGLQHVQTSFEVCSHGGIPLSQSVRACTLNVGCISYHVCVLPSAHPCSACLWWDAFIGRICMDSTGGALKALFWISFNVLDEPISTFLRIVCRVGFIRGGWER